MDTAIITAEVRQELAPGVEQWSTVTLDEMPGWAVGDPAMAVALYLFGYRQAVSEIRNAEVI